MSRNHYPLAAVTSRLIAHLCVQTFDVAFEDDQKTSIAGCFLLVYFILQLLTQSPGAFNIIDLWFFFTSLLICSIYVSTFYDTSRFFINDGALEIADFKERYLSRHQVGSSSSSSRIVRGLDEDFVNKHSFSSIASIVEPLEPMKVSIVATITAVYPSGQWSYLACPKCNTTVKTSKSESQREDGSSDSSGHWCSKCNAAVTEPVDRYKVPIVVDDCTGSVTLTLFDRDVVGLIHLH